jgi:RNA polymerase sigma-70 factor (ECF subfamily)
MPYVPSVETIFKNYKDKVYRLGLSISRNEGDAEDILQNTFLKVARYLERFRRQSNVSTWIYRIAYNEALMLLRKRKRQFRLLGRIKKQKEKFASALFVNWSRLPDEQLLDKEFKERIDGSIRHIAIRYRMPLLLSAIEDLTVKDAASVLGITHSSLKTRLHRAHMMIRNEIASYFKDKEEPKEKRCGLLTGFVYEYAKGNLSRKRMLSFKKHIADCSPCNSFLDTYLKAIRITGALQCKDLPFELASKIKSFLKI